MAGDDSIQRPGRDPAAGAAAGPARDDGRTVSPDAVVPDTSLRDGPEETAETGTVSSPAVSDERVWQCDLCGARMRQRHCKLLCPQCGYQRDCSDP